MRRLLSLFDYSGTWSKPFWDLGWDVIQVDLKHGDDVSDFTAEMIMDRFLDDGCIDGVLLAPPCTHFTYSGARWWNDKDRDGRTAAMVELVWQGIRTVEMCRPDFWALENPPGRIDRLVDFLKQCKKFTFDPCDFAGLVPKQEGDQALIDRLIALEARKAWGEITPELSDVTKRLNRYTKRTNIWGTSRTW